MYFVLRAVSVTCSVQRHFFNAVLGVNLFVTARDTSLAFRLQAARIMGWKEEVEEE